MMEDAAFKIVASFADNAELYAKLTMVAVRATGN